MKGQGRVEDPPLILFVANALNSVYGARLVRSEASHATFPSGLRIW
jgi:hypothetical protein